MATTKKDLVARVAADKRTRQVLVKRVIQQFFGQVIAELARGNRLEFRDFGVFETRTASASMAQNPRTLQRVRVEARRKVVSRADRLPKMHLNHRLQP